MFHLLFILAEQNFFLVGGHFGLLNKTFFIPDLYSAHTKKGETFNFNVLFLFYFTLDFN